MNKRLWGLLSAVILAGALVTGVIAANGITWVGATPAANLSHNSNVRAESSLALGPDNRVAVIWSSKNAPHSVSLAQTQGSGWTTTTLAATNLETWYPAVAYSGTKVIAAWAQGATRDDRSKPRAVIQMDSDMTEPQTVITPVFGNIEIDLAIAPTGMHMIFAASTNPSSTIVSKFPWDLYYTHRYFTETTWSPPTIVITYAQVIPPQMQTDKSTAGIWEPRLAVNNDGTQLNLVWRQEYRVTPIETTYFTYTVWHASGDWQAGHIDWSTPQQVSPSSQKYTVRPDVAVGPTGKVHIMWTELVPGSGSTLNPNEQHINYVKLGNPTPTRINGEAIRVNNTQPTWATSAMAINGSHMCAAWHGFYAPLGVSGTEEVIMRCSRDEGESWQALINVSESKDNLSLFPVVKINATRQAHVVWVEFGLVVNQLVPIDLFYRTGTSEITLVFLPLVMRRS